MKMKMKAAKPVGVDFIGFWSWFSLLNPFSFSFQIQWHDEIFITKSKFEINLWLTAFLSRGLSRLNADQFDLWRCPIGNSGNAGHQHYRLPILIFIQIICIHSHPQNRVSLPGEA